MKVKRKTVAKKEKYACCDQLFDGRGALIEHDKVAHTDKKYGEIVIHYSLNSESNQEEINLEKKRWLWWR